MKVRVLSVHISVLLASLCSSAAFAVSRYTFTDLGALTPNGSSRALDINNQGVIVGYSFTQQGPDMPTLWANGQISNVAGPDGRGIANGINEQGQIVGSQPGGLASVATLWDGATTRQFGYGEVNAINESGVMIGSSTWPAPKAVGVSNGGGVHLTNFGSTYVTAADINNAGQGVVSGFVPGSTVMRAGIWSQSGLQMLAPLPGTNNIIANAINDAGMVVGSSYANGGGNRHATLWDNGVAINLSPNDDGTIAHDINELGQIVGSDHSLSAMLWEDGIAYDLNRLTDFDPLEWQLEEAFAINDHGWIVGSAFFLGNPDQDAWGSRSRAFLLRPIAAVPEPETYGMLAAGLLLIAGVRRKKRAQGSEMPSCPVRARRARPVPRFDSRGLHPRSCLLLPR